jgi:hypothetical protein
MARIIKPCWSTDKGNLESAQRFYNVQTVEHVEVVQVVRTPETVQEPQPTRRSQPRRGLSDEEAARIVADGEGVQIVRAQEMEEQIAEPSISKVTATPVRQSLVF